MFSRVIPSREQIKQFKQPLTDGEQCLLDFLDDNLKKDNLFAGGDIKNYDGWLIFVQPYLNGSRPDIIIFRPNVGAQIFEVKDWNLENYRFESARDSVISVRGNNGEYCPIKSPIKQAEYYKDLVVDQLIPQIGEKIDLNRQFYGLIKTAVYFHKSTTELVHSIFKNQVTDFSSFPVFGLDALITENINAIVPDHGITTSSYWVKDWNKELIFWLKPPFHAIREGTDIHLTNEQKRFSEPKSGHHRIRGVAGSGKTQILAYRASNLASQGKRVLILTRNITLQHYIHDMVQKSPLAFIWSNITIRYFHGLCLDILNEFGEIWPYNDDDNDQSMYTTLISDKIGEIIKRNDYDKFDAILIDEGQDFHFEWYEMLCGLLSEQDEMVVVSDKKQNIYGTDTLWLDKRRVGVEKFGDWIELKKIFRLPERIARITKNFCEEFKLNQDLKIENIEKPGLFNPEDHVIWWNIGDKGWIEYVDEAYEIIKNHATHNHPQDTVVLLPDKKFGFECVKYFGSKKNLYNINHVFEDDSEKKCHRNKKAFWMGAKSLKMSTIHSFKGWEVPNVIIVVTPLSYMKESLSDNLLYSAMTRAKENLIVINMDPRYREFGNDYSKQWK